MSAPSLYSLLPEWYRARDAAAGREREERPPIEAWLERAEVGYQRLHQAASGAYDDWFVETCGPKLLPAIGALVGLELNGPPLPGDRRLVADALARWRRKGSAWALRDALEAACGWSVEVLEFDETLRTTPSTSHARADTTGSLGATSTRSVGVSGGPNLRRVEVRVRRGFGVVVEGAEPTSLGQGWYALDPGGLLHRISTEAAQVCVVAGGRNISLRKPSGALERSWAVTPQVTPASGEPVLDASRGRFWLPVTDRTRVRVSWVAWRPGPIGAGLPNSRVEPPAGAWRALVSRDFSSEELGSGCYRSVTDAIAAWPKGRDADVRILDSGAYGMVVAPARAGGRLTLHADAGEHPRLNGLAVASDLALSGMTVTGELCVTGGGARIEDCTLRGRVLIGSGVIRRSQVGCVEVSGPGEIEISDSIVGERSALGGGSGAEGGPTGGDSEVAADSSIAGPHADALILRAERSTFLGRVTVGEIAFARDCLFCAPVWVARPHSGRVEHCPHPLGSRLGAGSNCEVFDAAGAPQFLSRAAASPGYGWLCGPEALLRAASDGGQPGAFHSVHEGARQARIARTLERFLPVGFTANIQFIQEGGNG